MIFPIKPYYSVTLLALFWVVVVYVLVLLSIWYTGGYRDIMISTTYEAFTTTLVIVTIICTLLGSFLFIVYNKNIYINYSAVVISP